MVVSPCKVVAILCVSAEGRVCDNNVPVGVALLRNNIDIAEPGRGLGLGLGGASLALAQSLSSSIVTTSKAIDMQSDSLESPFRPEPALAASPGPVWVKSSGSGARVANRSVFDFIWASALPRGVRPDARTFFRALNPMQSTNCLMASRSDTARRGAVRVRRSVLAHERVLMPRIGVTSPLAAMAGVRGAEAWYARAGAAGVAGVLSGNASGVGPHEKPMKKDSASSRRMERGDVRKIERAGELSSSDG